MRKELVEIFSDQANAAVVRHPGRNYPGLLLQGDSLYSLYRDVDELCQMLDPTVEAFLEADDLRNRLRAFLVHYKNVLAEHEITLPFSDFD
ncbi:MAG: hypothetical protein H6920_00495 [Sphingomonadaceae bacterium]|nr:hypothetical protein [Sphingomonadaceae bacterium]MCP5384777.1 hypothetical protein [Altererythrobacter sp.]MCP5390093.1 hypothetical protein [Sphingomonadaceae bacterium]MCP5392574.1 hypothetical protein [Sphingomonadaceae bacterium]